VKHHGAGLLRLTEDEALVKGLTEDYTSVELPPADRAMLDYVAKLTRAPGTMERSDVEALRSAGFPDDAILDINQVTGYYAFANRLADGLGLDLEPGKE
jgi:uncharacterized peroxidase-related enzyme